MGAGGGGGVGSAICMSWEAASLVPEKGSGGGTSYSEGPAWSLRCRILSVPSSWSAL